MNGSDRKGCQVRLLLIEDETALRVQLVDSLRRQGYAVDATGSGEEGAYLGNEYPFDVAVVDLGLPDISGMEVIRRWREHARSLPVLILTAQGRWQDKVAGLEAGADDYLVKPFHHEELLARLNALVRRAAGRAHGLFSCGPVELDSYRQQLSLEGRPVELTAYEYRLIHYLILNAGKVVSRGELTEHLYEQDYERDSNVLEVLIGRLRRKLDPGGELRPIETLRGQGYRFTLECSGA